MRKFEYFSSVETNWRIKALTRLDKVIIPPQKHFISSSFPAMPESSAWQDICRWEFCPDHEDDDDDDDIDIDQVRI